MKTILSSMKNRLLARIGIFLIVVALIAGIVGCGGESCALVIASTEGGSVAVPGEGMFTYDKGTVVNLTAEAEEGYCFVNWTGDVGTFASVIADTTTFTTNADYSIMANFVEVWTTFPSPNVGEAIRGDISERGYLFPSDVQGHNPFH
jgi:hypothetical protein